MNTSHHSTVLKTHVLFLLLCLQSQNCFAQDTSRLSSISLAPHITELIYSAGAGETLVGVSAYSDYPESVKHKQTIGDAFHLNLELITQLKPDFVFYWHDSTPKQTIEQLKSMNLNLIPVEINQLKDIPKAIRHIAQTLKTKPQKATDQFAIELDRLKTQQRKRMTALIQISDQPIYTVNGSHWMSEAIAVCGLDNVFSSLSVKSAAVNLESVILKKPEVIVRTSPMSQDHKMRTWENIPAISNNHIISLEADHFTRPTLRTMSAIESLCTQLTSLSN